MSFRNHIFISYSHIDNQPLSAKEEGWVTRFHAILKGYLEMRLGVRKAAIWRDEKLRGNDIFADEILTQLPQSAVLLSVLSPGYLSSEWCGREVTEFCRLSEQSGGLRVGNGIRIFKIIKTPVDSQEAIPIFKEILGDEFFVYNEEQAPLELDPSYGPPISQQYQGKVATLAWKLAQFLKQIDPPAQAGPTPIPPSATKPVIYLAECSKDRRSDRDALHTELQMLGYSVLPDRALPWSEAEYVPEVRRLLERARLSIHLIGKLYEPLDGTRSIAAIQNELAVERSRQAGLHRLIWNPQSTVTAHPSEQPFLQALETNRDVLFGADMVTANIETFKVTMQSTLKKLEEPEPAKLAAAEDTRTIYLICDPRDRKATVPLRQALRARGWEARLPAFDGDSAAVRQTNQQELATCKAVLLFYGAGDEPWRRSVEHELERAPDYRGGKPLPPAWTCLAEPDNADKTDLFDMSTGRVIDARAGFNEALLAPFLEAVTGKGVGK